MKAATVTQTHEPRSRPSFRERVFMLAGHGTWMEPSDGAKGAVRPIPSDHLVAAALAFGRRGKDDIGPDIAFDWALQRPGHWAKVCEWLGRELGSDRGASAKRLRPWAAHLAVHAYNALVRGYQPPPAPDGVRDDDWGEMLLFACLLLERAAEDALAVAARRARRAG